MRGHVRVWGEFCCSAPQYGWGHGGRRGTHTGKHTHTGTYTQMLHLPFSDLPFKKCPSHPKPSLTKPSLLPMEMSRLSCAHSVLSARLYTESRSEVRPPRTLPRHPGRQFILESQNRVHTKGVMPLHAS